MGSQSQTTTQKQEPWEAAQPELERALGINNALYNQGSYTPTPYGPDRVASIGGATRESRDMILDQARSGGVTPVAQGSLTQMMSGDWQSDRLQEAQDYSLDRAIPAAVAPFAMSGMTDSTPAMDTVGQAATDAVAPYSFSAMMQQDQNTLRAAGLSPTVDAGAYLPGQMVGNIGAVQDAQRQDVLNADIQNFYEAQGAEQQGFETYADQLTRIAGMGGQRSTTEPGPGVGVTIGGAGLSGLGMYGTLAANPVTAPFAIPGGIVAGLAGLF